MTKNKNIEKIKNTIVQNVGNNFDIVAKHGRKKILFENCTVDSAYPSIFIVKASGAKAGIKGSVSFSYSDILTKNVCIFPPFSIKKEKGA